MTAERVLFRNIYTQTSKTLMSRCLLETLQYRQKVSFLTFSSSLRTCKEFFHLVMKQINPNNRLILEHLVLLCTSIYRIIYVPKFTDVAKFKFQFSDGNMIQKAD